VIVGGSEERWLLTQLFFALGVYYLAMAARAVRGSAGGRLRGAADSGLHVLMSGAMISMLWPWGVKVPVIAPVTVFTAAAGWFAGHALFGSSRPQGLSGGGNWFQAAMMAVMVWMAVIMPLRLAQAAGPQLAGTSMPAGGMAGMVMDGGTMAASQAAGIPAGWPGTVCVVLAVALFAAAAWQLFAAVRPLALAGPGGSAPGVSGAVAVARDGVGVAMAAGAGCALLVLS
jgi:Domain of unknown function (DUF5134)